MTGLRVLSGRLSHLRWTQHTPPTTPARADATCYESLSRNDSDRVQARTATIVTHFLSESRLSRLFPLWVGSCRVRPGQPWRPILNTYRAHATLLTALTREFVGERGRLNEPSIQAVGLTKRYGSFTALDSLNLNVEGSKCVGFLGPNGAGKTTTLKLFTDLIRASSGEALVNGVNVHTRKKKALESVGTLIETPEIYPSLTPREALSMVAETRGVPAAERKKRIEDVVTEVRMDEWVDKRVGKFSKGMKQRINIAAALLSDPRIFLLDEPSTGLDPRGMSEVRDIVKSLKGKQRLIFMSSHLLSEVTDICDEVAMIDHGKLLVYDTLSNVTSRFSGGENIVEVGFLRPLDGGVNGRIASGVPGVTSAERVDDRTLRIRFNGGASTQERLLSNLVGMNLGVISYKPASSALEDVYLSLIKDTK
ncbi:MAG: ABC transporter ATP-binding protein [Thaumarchaeota archaeon]|nr:MAG: ABC transporter ATP-binding protein [Nitrososphaerota archaeon]